MFVPWIAAQCRADRQQAVELEDKEPLRMIDLTCSGGEVSSFRKSDCLVLLAHGSRDPRWRAPFERIVDAVQGQSGETDVRLAYMEFVGPTLMDVARECVGKQILHLRVLPLFLSMGTHLVTDVPEQVREAKEQFPQLEVEVLATIGEDPRVTRLIQQIVIETLDQ